MYPEDEVIASTGIQLDDNLFRVPARSIERELLALYPYIETVRLHRQLFPPSIEIRAQQSVPSAALAVPGGEFVFITRTGKVLERGLVLLEGDILLVQGIDVQGRGPGDFLGQFELAPISPGETPAQSQQRELCNERLRLQSQQEASGLIMINNLLDAMYTTDFVLTNVDVTDRFNMQIMYENRLLFQLGTDAHLADKLMILHEIVYEHLHPEAHGVVDASAYITRSRAIFTPDPGFNSDGSPINRFVLGY